MKRIFAISTFIISFALISLSAPNSVNGDTEFEVDKRFVFDIPDFDPTTVFISMDENPADEMSECTIPMIEADDIISYAKQYLGRPYRSGAKGPKAFDCSGFTSFIYRNFDIDLNASSSAQSTQGEKIARGDIRPGDLLFFKGRRKGSVGHVGIAVEVEASGNVKFIHAATSSGIRIDNLNDAGYYQKRYVGARRVLN